ncbi:hypothetical protein KJ671_00275 [Patescibacteria group bacterium]|nr:hypothetical protein [Patescibacteria group bacterium]
MILRGYVLSVLWGWFIVPVFHLPELTLAVAIGIAMIMSIITHQHSTKKYENDIKKIKSTWSNEHYNKLEAKEAKEALSSIITLITNLYLNLLLVLFIGWIVHLFM